MLLQATLFLLISLIGSLLTLILVVVYCRTRLAEVALSKYSRLPVNQQVISAIYKITRPTISKIALATSLSEESVVHYVEFMRMHKYIKENDPLSLTEEGYRAVQQL